MPETFQGANPFPDENNDREYVSSTPATEDTRLHRANVFGGLYWRYGPLIEPVSCL